MIPEDPNFSFKTLWQLPDECETSVGPIQEEKLREAYLNDEIISNAKQNGVYIHREIVEYKDGETTLYGLAAWPTAPPHHGGGGQDDGPAGGNGTGGGDRRAAAGAAAPAPLRPGVLVAHAAVGAPEDAVLWRLDALAALGYVAFAADFFGSPRALWDRAASLAARAPLVGDAERRGGALQRRARRGLAALQALPGVDTENLAALGYCFGGMCVLDLAKADVPELKAVVTFHGILDTPALTTNQIHPNTALLVLHGAADPFVPPEAVAHFTADLDARGGGGGGGTEDGGVGEGGGAAVTAVDWELRTYGGAMHAFTRPEKLTAADRAAGLQHCPRAARRAWAACRAFLRRRLPPPPPPPSSSSA